MSIVFDQDSECGFVYGSLIEFMKCWENGANSRLVLETVGGNAWVNLSCCLGRPHENHVISSRRKQRRQEEKNLRRAAEHQKKLEKEKADSAKNENVTMKANDERDTLDVYVNVTTSKFLDVKNDKEGVKKFNQSVAKSVVDELTVDSDIYVTGAEPYVEYTDYLGEIYDDEWEYELKYKLKIKEGVLVSDLKQLINECRVMNTRDIRNSEAIRGTDLKSLRFGYYS